MKALTPAGLRHCDGKKLALAKGMPLAAAPRLLLFLCADHLIFALHGSSHVLLPPFDTHVSSSLCAIIRRHCVQVSLTVGFLVFASAMFELQARSIVSNVRMFLGADVVALVLTTASSDSQAGSNGTAPGYPLPQAEMAAFLDADRARGGSVVDYTFISIPLTAIPVVRRSSLTNLVNVPRLANRLYGVQENFLDVAYREFAVVTESSAAGVDADTPGVSAPAADGGGGGSVASFVRAQPIRALYSGAGALTLPLEATLPGPPQTLLSASAASGSVGYVCAAAAAASAEGSGSSGRDDGWLLRVPASYMASPAQYAAFTHDGLVSVYAPEADSADAGDAAAAADAGSSSVAAAPSPAAVVSTWMSSGATDVRLPTAAGSGAATFARAADFVRRNCNYDGSGCGGGGSAAASAAAAAGNGSSAAAAAAALLRSGQLLFSDYAFCAAACADGFTYNRAAAAAGLDGRLQPPGTVWPAVANGDWLWAPPGGDGTSGGAGATSWIPPCALANGSWAAAALGAAANSPSAWGGAAPLYLYDLDGSAPAAAGIVPNAIRAAGFAGAAAGGFNISSSASGRALALARALTGASACMLPPGAGCLPVSRASPFASADRVTNAYLRYIDVLQSEAMRGGSSLSTLTPLALRMQNRDPDSGFFVTRAYLAKCRAMLRKLPGFLFSSYSQTAFRSPVILRMRDAARLYADSLIDYRSIVQSITGRGGGGGGGGSGQAQPSSVGNASTVVVQKRVFFPPVPLWFAPRSGWLTGTFPPSVGLSLTAMPASGIASGSPPLLPPPSAALDGDAASVWVQPLPALTAAAGAPEAELVAATGPQAKLLGLPILPPLADLLYPYVAVKGGSGSGSGAGSTAPLAAESVCPGDNAAAQSTSGGSGDGESDGSVLSDTLAAAGCPVAAALPSLPAAWQTVIRSAAVAGVKTAAMNSNNTVIMTLDLGSCGLVAGLRLSTNTSAIAAALAASSFGGGGGGGGQGVPAPLVAVSLYAMSDPSGRGVARVASLVAPLQASLATASAGSAADFAADFSATFTGFSARYWAVAVTPLYPAGMPLDARVIVIPDVSLAVGRVAAVAGACQGGSLGASDAAPELAKHRLMVRLKDGATAMERQRVINGLRSYLRSAVVQIQDTNALVASTDVAVIGLNIFFIFVATLALVLAFFSVWLSFSSNVRENSTEFGILRSLGLPAAAVTRAYIYEALSVVLTAFGLGTAVGLLVASTLTLQFNLFTEMPFEFNFPTALFVLTLLGSIALAMVASYFPARAIARLDIAGVLKGRAA